MNYLKFGAYFKALKLLGVILTQYELTYSYAVTLTVMQLHKIVKFVASKSHVAPVKQQSISHLELLGAVIESLTTFYLYFLCRFSVFNGWTQMQDKISIFGSKLHWIKPWKQYVGHLIKEIHQMTAKNQWYHFPGIFNPADLPFRGTTKELVQSNM